MNLRKAENYNIGLDIGTGSVGWAVTDENGELYHFKKKPTWGSRLFPSAETAATARMPRGQRRRYDRRRQRLNWLQGFFLEEMEKTDPDFFIRLNQSRLLPEDRDEDYAGYRWPFFNNSDFTEADYYAKFPTIYHLRSWLMETEEQADIRLIYLAFHNIVKVRGNFLHQDNKGLSAKNANMELAIDQLCDALDVWCQEREIDFAPSKKEIQAVFENSSLSKKEKQEEVVKCFGFAAAEKKRASSIVGAILGYKCDYSKTFEIEAEGANFSLDNDEAVESFYSQCSDDCLELFDAIRAAYSSLVLLGILGDANSETISYCKIRDYEQYGEDLKLLKQLVREYRPSSYNDFFRGPHFEDERWKKDYDPNKAAGYTLYNLGTSKLNYDDFAKEVKKLFAGTEAESDPCYLEMMAAFAETRFLRRLKTTDNGSIPYQLHLEEMDAIIENQGTHYPFLLNNKEKIKSLVSFRIPYYVGPLTTKNARRKNDNDPSSSMRFAWSVRQEGKDNEPIRPWNWEEIIDKDESAAAFIERMTGTCTYLHGEPVLPRCSLLYEKYCVLNELNGAKISFDGDREHRLSYDYRASIVENLFKQQASVSYAAVEKHLKQINGPGIPHVRGGQGEKGFESKLSSHNFFCKVLQVDDLDDETSRMVEELIRWNTLFEDREMLKEKIRKTYGDRLSEEQIKAIVKKRFTGWGRLSKKLLCEMKTDTVNGPMSIMDILEEGNPHGKHIGEAMVLMEILHDASFGFLDLIENINKESASAAGGLQIDDLPGSPALRRGVNQAIRIVDEIVSITKKPPANIFIEVTRDDDKNKKGKRTTRRYDHLKEALEALGAEGKEALGDLTNIDAQQLNEQLSLYFMQNGKSLYSGKTLDLRRIMSGDGAYQVDHIIPQSYIKDDSFDNKALVLAGENQRKADDLLLDPAIRQKMSGYWRSLREADLISEKKFNNLMRSSVSDKQMQGFINRQLVETSQIVKFVRMMLEERYPEANVESIKASLSHQLRKEKSFVKCREANNYHHAHDALLAAEIGRFIQLRHANLFENPIGATHVMKEFIRSRSEYYKKHHDLPGSATFVIGSFLTSGFDKETGEIYKDTWDADAECEKIRCFLNYKDCYISRMPEITSGAFWGANPLSPKDPKNKSLIELKKGLSTGRYGGYSGKDYAFFFAYKFRKGKKVSLEFCGVPLNAASLIEKGDLSLEEYASSLAKENGGDCIQVIRRKVFTRQLVSINGCRLYVTGLGEVRNGTEIAFSQEQLAIIKLLVGQNETTKSEREKLYTYILAQLPERAARLAANLRISDSLALFSELSEEQQGKIILGLVALVNADNRVIDLTNLGKAKTAGQQKVSFAKELSSADSDFTFIDQSVTGMFERRQKIEL